MESRNSGEGRERDIDRHVENKGKGEDSQFKEDRQRTYAKTTEKYTR